MTAQELAQRLEPLFPALDERDRRLSLALYRELAGGAPASLPEEGLKRMRDWPGVYYDAERRVIGFWGLSLAKARHRLRIGEHELFAWCAWDALFLPAVLRRRIEVESTCHGTGEAVRLAVSPTAVESAEPPQLVVSFVVPDAEAVRADVIASFCHYVYFFSSEDAAGAWRGQHREGFLLSLAEAFELGRLLNLRRYGAALTSAG